MAQRAYLTPISNFPEDPADRSEHPREAAMGASAR
jgi:hypothetical protein